MTFQSTPPVWGATATMTRASLWWPFQSTPPVWGATVGHGCVDAGGRISIHAPRVGGDWTDGANTLTITVFQSTPPVWGATIQGRTLAGVLLDISIHAPRVGGDRAANKAYFIRLAFQSTPPVWGATNRLRSGY